MEQAKGKQLLREPQIVIPGAHEPIIDEALFKRANDNLVSRRIVKSRVSTKDYHLTGIVFCGHCGHRMFGTAQNNKPVYMCTQKSRGFCNAFRISKDAIEGLLFEMIERELLSPEADAKLRDRITKRARKLGNAKQAKTLESRLVSIQKKLTIAVQRLMTIPPEYLREAETVLDGLRTEEQELLEKVALSGRSGSRPEAVLAAALDNRKQIREAIQSGSPELVKSAMALCFRSVTLWWNTKPSKGRFCFWFDHGSIQLREGGTIAVSEADVMRLDRSPFSGRAATLAIQALYKGIPVKVENAAEYMGVGWRTAHTRLNSAVKHGYILKIGHYRTGYVPAD